MDSIKKIGFFTAFIIPTMLILGYNLGGWWNASTVVFAFGIIPLLDHLVGLDTKNATPDESKALAKEAYYRMIMYIWVYIEFAVLVWGFWVISMGKLQNFYEYAFFTLGMSLVTGGVGITVAHELGHKHSKLERFYSKFLLMMVCYMHFYIEHNRGHHVWVATPQDPATARKNESFYAFYLRCVRGCYKHAWQLENDRMRRRGLSWIHNEMVWYTVLPIVFAGLATAVFSVLAGRLVWELPLFFVAQALFAFTLLEQVNYIEHYGIRRKELSPGEYERVSPLHSWNASHLVSNFFLFQLQRHSDHHANAARRWQVLRHFDESPQLPNGYTLMIILALIPPIWFKLMNPKLLEWEKNAQLGQAA